MYVRAKTVPAIFETNAKVTRAIRAGALAINCDLEIRIHRVISRSIRTRT